MTFRCKSDLILCLALLPLVALSASKELTARAWLSQAPPLPSDARGAYDQWIDNNGELKPGTTFKALEDGLMNVMKDQMNAAAPTVNGAQMNSAVSSAEQFRQQYGTSEGQAKLKSMSPAELMALSQQMRPQQPTMSAPPSQHDIELAKKIGAYPGTIDVQQGIRRTRSAADDVIQQWQKDKEALDAQEQRARSALPLCRSEAGEPSEISLRDNAFKFADLRIALATKYLGKLQPSVQQLRSVVGPRIDYGDAALVAWSGIESASLKAQFSAAAHGNENTALGDVGVVQAFIEGISKRAAQAVADKKQIERAYANAKGC